MRKAEITLLSALFWIVTTVVGAYVEREYGLTAEIERVIDSNTTTITIKRES